VIAAHAARRRPNVFGLVGGQSGFYSYQKDALMRDYAAAQNLGIRFYLNVGTFETDLHGNGKPEDDLSPRSDGLWNYCAPRLRRRERGISRRTSVGILVRPHWGDAQVLLGK
jgi:hypothetical protein